MKKQFFTLLLCILTSAGAAFANNADAVSSRVKTSFEREFSGAQSISWTVSKEYSKATFMMNGQVLFAYYDESGNRLALSRNLLPAQLPINLEVDLKKSYGKYWISDLFEIASNNETTYYVTVENADYKYVLKSSGVQWETYRKEKK